jgi:hypothetical protein
MTEAEWQGGGESAPMLAQLGAQASGRKQRLLACANCRRWWNELSWPTQRRAVEVAERFADGRASDADLAAAAETATMVAAAAPQFEAFAYQAAAAAANEDAAEALRATLEALEHVARSAAAAETAPGEDEAAVVAAALADERRAQAVLIRELFGNPFRPVAADPFWLCWNDGCVVKMARVISDDRHWTDLPILGDALEEAGCNSQSLLRHCRQPAGHVPGCWALDLLLGQG